MVQTSTSGSGWQVLATHRAQDWWPQLHPALSDSSLTA